MAGFSLGAMRGNYPVPEPYVLFALGLVITFFMLVNGIAKGNTAGDIFYGASVLWIVFGVLSFIGTGMLVQEPE